MEDDSSEDRHVENPLGEKALSGAAQGGVRASEAAALKADEVHATGKSCIPAYQFYWSVIKESPRTHKVFVTLVVVQAIWLVVSVSRQRVMTEPSVYCIRFAAIDPHQPTRFGFMGRPEGRDLVSHAHVHQWLVRPVVCGRGSCQSQRWRARGVWLCVGLSCHS